MLQEEDLVLAEKLQKQKYSSPSRQPFRIGLEKPDTLYVKQPFTVVQPSLDLSTNEWLKNANLNFRIAKRRKETPMKAVNVHNGKFNVKTDEKKTMDVDLS